MLKSAVGRVMWVGRATVFLVGLAVILAILLGVATKALGATGGNFILGKSNAANAVSRLAASVAGPALNLINNNADPAATALNLHVAPGHSPLTVNSSAKVSSLNADQLDGKNDTDFYAAGAKVSDSELLDGKDSTEFLAANGKAQDASHADNADHATSADNASTLGGKSANQLTRAASGEAHTPVTLTGTLQDYGQVTINAPTAGYVMATGIATVQGSAFCENCLVQGILVNNTNGAAISGNTEGSDVPAGGYAELSDTAVLPVNAGSNTIALRLIGTGTGGSTISAVSSHVSAIYSPYDGSGNPR